MSTQTASSKPINTTAKGRFVFPREHSFPPFYTRQPIPGTLQSQLHKWSSLVLSYCQYHQLYKLSISTALTSDLFANSQIRKKLDLAFAKEIIECMRREGRAEWIADGKDRGKWVGGGGGAEDVAAKDVCWIYWKTPEEWGVHIAKWVDETGQKNTVLTLYELTESEATLGQDFHGMDADVLQKALSTLVKRGKAQIFGQEDGQGIKFF